jgi:hypothetical protein
MKNVDKRIQLLISYKEAREVIRWLNENGDFRKDLSDQQIDSLAIDFASGGLLENQSILHDMLECKCVH